MLGAVTSGAQTFPVSIPPRPGQLTATGKRDWQTGVELIETCMRTHDTATGLSPEIVHFRIPSDNLNLAVSNMPQDWYIKGAQCVSRSVVLVLIAFAPDAGCQILTIFVR